MQQELHHLQVHDVEVRDSARRGGPQVQADAHAAMRRHGRRHVLAHAPARQGHDLPRPAARTARPKRCSSIPNYHFDWQQNYRWQPGTKKFPKGTRIEVTAHFDNSPFNPFNPDPKATVKHGPQTFRR